MKKLIRLSESELVNLVKLILTENKKNDMDLCDEFTVSSLSELKGKMKGMDISKKDRQEVNRLISDMKKELKYLDSDLDVLDTYLHKIQSVICTHSKEDRNNID